MHATRTKPIHLIISVLALALLAGLFVSCGTSAPSTPQERYGLTDEEVAAWDRLYVVEAESLLVELWSHIGKGEFDQAMLMVTRFDDRRMKQVFQDRVDNLWNVMINWPADQLLKEPQIGLGEGQTVGFNTWGELWQGGFQRAVIADDSITVYFVFKGYWQTERVPVYAAVSCGDFGEEQIQWQPFAHMVFSLDESKEAIKALGQSHRAENLEQFVAYLKTRTFGTFKL